MNTVHESDNTSDNFPIVGKGATIINFQSKYAYEVLDVNSNEDEVIIKRYLPTKDGEDDPSSQDQTYIFKILGLNHIQVKKINGILFSKNRFPLTIT